MTSITSKYDSLAMKFLNIVSDVPKIKYATVLREWRDFSAQYSEDERNKIIAAMTAYENTVVSLFGDK